jgi:hypothetical protein
MVPIARLVLALVLLLPQSAGAFLTPGKTSGTEVALIAAGPSLWDLTIETATGASNDFGGQLSIDNAVSFDPNPLICDPAMLVMYCVTLTAAELGDPTPSLQDNLFFILAVVQAGALDGGTGNPRTLGRITSNGTPQLTLEGLYVQAPTTNPTGFAPPVTFVNGVIPEPSPLHLLALALASLVLARKLGSTSD